MTFDNDSDHKLYTAIWQNMQRENELINHRISWAILLSAGIFAATAVLATIVVNADKSIPVLCCVFVLMAVLSWIGYIFSRRTRSAVAAAQDQHDTLRGEYEKHFKDSKLPRPFGESSSRDRGKAASLVFPILLVRIWLAAAIIEMIIAQFLLFVILDRIGFVSYILD